VPQAPAQQLESKAGMRLLGGPARNGVRISSGARAVPAQRRAGQLRARLVLLLLLRLQLL